MKFKSGLEMYEYLCKKGDLYSKNSNTYAFCYNDAGAICIYSIEPEEAVDLIKKSRESKEYWGAFLGIGGFILDDARYDDAEHRYSDDWEKCKLYLNPTLCYCEEHYTVEDWMDTNDVEVSYLME